MNEPIYLKCECNDMFLDVQEAYQHSLDLSTEDRHHGQFELISEVMLTDQEKANLVQPR
jgi:hypothetical protein